MAAEKSRSEEALALERVVNAAREVQAAAAALEQHFAPNARGQPSTLELARFAVAMQELRDAREAFDAVLAGESKASR
jgi:predicted negative regulator of RcsB-dependent stress response